MIKVQTKLFIGLASAMLAPAAVAAVPNDLVDHACPLRNVDTDDLTKWQEAVLSNNGILSNIQLSRIMSETKKCAASEGWSDEQAKWVAEINVAGLAYEAYSTKMYILGIDTFVDLSIVDKKSISELEAIVQNPDNDADMQSIAQKFREGSSIKWTADHDNATRDYLSTLAAFSLALIQLTGEGLFAGAISVSEM